MGAFRGGRRLVSILSLIHSAATSYPARSSMHNELAAGDSLLYELAQLFRTRWLIQPNCLLFYKNFSGRAGKQIRPHVTPGLLWPIHKMHQREQTLIIHAFRIELETSYGLPASMDTTSGIPIIA
jgi:hypothetical protein